MSFNLSTFKTLPRALTHRNFALYMAGNSISLIGMWVQRLAMGWLIWELTGSGAWLGAVALAEFIPNFLITPFGGVLADRFDRRKLALLAQSLACLQAVILCVLTALEQITPTLMVALGFYSGLAFALGQSARLALIPSLIPEADLAAAIATTSVTFNIARVFGPAVAGIIISTFGVAPAFGFNALSYVTIILALLALKLPPTPPKPGPSGHILTQVFTDFVEGWRYAKSKTAIASLIVILGIEALFVRPLGDLLPGLVGSVFSKGPEGLAIFTASMGGGAILAGLYLAQKQNLKGLTTLTLGSIAINGLGIALFASTHLFWLGASVMAVLGFTHVVSGTGSQTLIQSNVDDRMRGRVMGLWSLTLRGGPALGAVSLGWLSGFFGFSAPLFISGTLTALAALLMFRRRRLMADLLESTPNERGPR